MQSFDIYGRLNQVAIDGITGAFTYGYLENSHLQKTLAMPNGVTRTFGYEPNRDLLTLIVHSNSTDRLVQRDFTFDGLGRLENRTLFRASETPVQPDAFGYNARSELTNAVIGANAFAYNFDPIGNRLAATEFGTNTSYVASALNQYTSITPVSPADNAFTPAFDLDGNQTLLKTTTGIWQVWYNAENRPIIFSNDTTVVEMAYDYMGRRFEYKETVSGTLTRHERYLYRGYLQIAALDMLNSGSVKHIIAWDVSEPVVTRPLSLQIGANAYFYSFDQVKNVTELFNSVGSIAATYDYSPFGQVVTSAGDIPNPLTFSSEVHDSNLGLQYYNYRHLNVLDGRWISRDPIGEKGGMLVYGFISNKLFNKVDFCGLCKEGCIRDPWVDFTTYASLFDPNNKEQAQTLAQRARDLGVLENIADILQLVAAVKYGGAAAVAGVISDFFIKAGYSPDVAEDIGKKLLNVIEESSKNTQGVQLWTRVCYEKCECTPWSFIFGNKWVKRCDEWIAYVYVWNSLGDKTTLFASDKAAWKYVSPAMKEAMKQFKKKNKAQLDCEE